MITNRTPPLGAHECQKTNARATQANPSHNRELRLPHLTFVFRIRARLRSPSHKDCRYKRDTSTPLPVYRQIRWGVEILKVALSRTALGLTRKGQLARTTPRCGMEGKPCKPLSGYKVPAASWISQPSALAGEKDSMSGVNDEWKKRHLRT